jgi:Ca-activated chloride channel family protein
MFFQWPTMLWLLLLIPVLLFLYILAQLRRQKYALRFASLSLVRDAIGRGPGFRRHIPPLLFLLALGVVIVALARPVAVVTLPKQEGIVILTFDVSGSMQADDVKPTRLDAAKTAARSFVDKEPAGVLIGVVAFSDNGSMVQTPTDDKTAVLAAINRLQPQRATAIGRGLLSSIEAIDAPANEEAAGFNPRFQRGAVPATPTPTPTPTPMPKGQYQPAIVILLSDGENTANPAPLQVIDELVNRGIRVYTIGLGTAAGTVLKIEGMSVRVRLDEATLQQIAAQTNGQYFNATTEKDLQTIYDNLATHFVLRSEKQEITAFLTAVAAVLSLFAGFLSLLWFNRLP